MSSAHSNSKQDNSDGMYGQSIAGNASDIVKRGIASVIGVHIRGYSDYIGKRIRILSADIQKKPEDEDKIEGKVICELDVVEGERLFATSVLSLTRIGRYRYGQP